MKRRYTQKYGTCNSLLTFHIRVHMHLIKFKIIHLHVRHNRHLQHKTKSLSMHESHIKLYCILHFSRGPIRKSRIWKHPLAAANTSWGHIACLLLRLIWLTNNWYSYWISSEVQRDRSVRTETTLCCYSHNYANVRPWLKLVKVRKFSI